MRLKNFFNIFVRSIVIHTRLHININSCVGSYFHRFSPTMECHNVLGVNMRPKISIHSVKYNYYNIFGNLILPTICDLETIYNLFVIFITCAKTLLYLLNILIKSNVSHYRTCADP